MCGTRPLVSIKASEVNVANRVVDNVIIIDSAMGNLNAVGGTSNNLTTYNVIGFSFLATTTASACIISGASTTDHIFRSSYVANETGSTAIFQARDSQTFALPIKVSALKVPVLTTGT